MPPDERVGPDPRLAFRLSLVLPGLGLFYAGAPLRAIAVAGLALLALGGIADSLSFMDRRPEYAWYGAVASAVLVAAWWGGAWHARTFASRAHGWPPLYRFLGQPTLWQALRPASVEIAMAALFALFTAMYFADPRLPGWMPEPPRYWFAYEALAALYAALAVRVRPAVFFALTLLATAALAALTGIPKGTLALAFLIALPCSWHALRHEGEESARLHWLRFGACLLAGFLAFIAYGVLLNAWEIVSGVPQYRLRLLRETDLALAVMGLLYYSLRAAAEVGLGRLERVKSS